MLKNNRNRSVSGISPEFDDSAERSAALEVAITQSVRNILALTPYISEEQIRTALDPLIEASRELKGALDTAIHEAMTDPGTGIPNRRYFERELQRTLEGAARQLRFNAAANDNVEDEIAPKKAIVFIDIVGLSVINKLGQMAGDKAIESVAQRLQEILRKGELGARVGGDEFAYLANDNANNPNFIQGVESRFKKGFEGVTFEYEGKAYPVNIYVAAFEIDPDLNAEDNMTIAGKKLADAKVAAGVARKVAEPLPTAEVK